MRIERAREADRPGVLALLESAALPAAGVDAHFDTFLLAREGEGESGSALAGCVGLELYDDVGLLRSLAVRPEHRSAGVGRELVERLIEDARARGVRAMYLLTTTAERYFPRFGFEIIDRKDADPRLGASEELRGACPDTAVLMRLEL